MGLLFSIITQQLNCMYKVLSPAKFLLWDGILDFADYFIQPWRSMFWLCFNVYVCLWRQIGSLSVKILVLPFRIYDAIQKEDAIDEDMKRVQKLHAESVERLGELEGEFERVVDECRRFKDLLESVEGEKRAILKKFQVLQLRVMQLEEENDILKAREERALKGTHERNVAILQLQNLRNNKLNTEIHKNESSRETRNKDELTPTESPRTPSKHMVESPRTPSKHRVESPRTLSKHMVDSPRTPSKHMAENMPLQLDRKHEGVPNSINKRAVVNHTLRYEGWEAAILSSIFSVFLTLLVGTISWQAQDPCVPLVVAVFMVVCMSLKTVAQFLLSIYKGPGFDAVALLSFNWFILGTLAYPVLPKIAAIVAPFGAKFGHWVLRVIGVTYLSELLSSAFL